VLLNRKHTSNRAECQTFVFRKRELKIGIPGGMVLELDFDQIRGTISPMC